MSLKKCVECVRKHKSFLITSHVNLEGDALGSELGFYYLVKKLGKRAVIVNEDDTPYSYGFLPGKGAIRKFGKKALRLQFDCFVALDCSDLKRTGEVYRLNNPPRAMLNIDHHVSNLKFGDVNWVDAKASSCSEMIYRLYKAFKVPFDRDAATALYAGISTDTGSFRYPNTTGLAHRAASELIKFGINPAQIYRSVYEDIPLEDARLLAKILPQMKTSCQGKIAWFQLRSFLLKHFSPGFDLSEHTLSFARGIKGVEVAALFKENQGVKGEIRINLRSQGKCDVNKVALLFGGGGHKTASGATVRGKLETVSRKVIRAIEKNL